MSLLERITTALLYVWGKRHPGETLELRWSPESGLSGRRWKRPAPGPIDLRPLV